MVNTYPRLVMQCLGALVCLLSIATAPALAYDWLQFGGNPQHSGNNTAETILNPGNIASLVQKYQANVPAIADGAPVFLEAVTTPAGVKHLLFVTTLDGRIIALDSQTGATVWSHQYGPGACHINNSGGSCYTTSSPAIDPNRAYVYSYGLDGNVHKYQVGDGTEIITVGWPQIVTLKGFDEKGSSALSTATSAGTTYLYVTHGGYPGDNGDYQGHVTAINLATGAQEVFNTACSEQAAHLHTLGGGVAPTCATRQNAIWSRPGVIYDAATDRIFMGTGNAFSGTPGQFDGNHNWSESVIALHPDATGGTGGNAGKPLDSYTPANHASLDSADADVGSTAPAILPVPPSSRVQHLAVQGGKDATLRLLNLQDLSGHAGPGNVGGEVGLIINVPQGGVVLSQPAVWVNPADGSTWIFVVNDNGASGLRLNFDANGNPSLSTRWQNGLSGTSPVVANNMVFFIGGSSVHALDPMSGSPLWSAARGSGTHWQSLIVANGVVYATDQAGHLAAFGLPQSSTQTTQTTLSSSLNPSPTVGTPVTFTATVTPLSGGGTPTGTITFKDGTTTIGSSSVNAGGVATLSTSALTAGTHSMTAVYGGDLSFQPSTSTALSQVVSSNLTCSGNSATNAIFVEHYYTTILRRPSEAGARASWMSEADRLCALGADPKQTFLVMANVFFNSPEYLAFNRDNNGFITDLYNAFFSRVPDPAGSSYWLGQLASGMPRNNVMSSFLFSAEFTATMNSAFPGQTARAETYLVLDLYGGLFRRLAESAGYTYWTGQLRTAQCNASPASAVQATIDSVSSQFVASAEYAARASTNSQYVVDMYYALLQRGAETAGYNYWVGQLNSGILTRGQVRQQFVASPEMQAQSAAIASQGCLP
jgi:hypothetical protein